MKVLLVAEQDFVANVLMTVMGDNHIVYSFITLQELARIDDVDSYLAQQHIDLVVNIATATLIEMGNVDTQWHVELLKPLLAAINALQLPLIHVSNSRVFDAEEGGRFRETDPPAPSYADGKLNCLLEEQVRQHPKALILRVSVLFDAEGDNLLTQLLRKFLQGGDIELAIHGHSAPIALDDFVRVMVALIKQLSCGIEVWGDYHYVSSDPTTNYHYAETVLSVMAQYADIDKVRLIGVDTLDQRWQRPLLNCEKLLHTFGIKQLPWRSAIVTSVKSYFKGQANVSNRK